MLLNRLDTLSKVPNKFFNSWDRPWLIPVRQFLELATAWNDRLESSGSLTNCWEAVKPTLVAEGHIGIVAH